MTDGRPTWIERRWIDRDQRPINNARTTTGTSRTSCGTVLAESVLSGRQARGRISARTFGNLSARARAARSLHHRRVWSWWWGEL
jgi:hypothetical protein